MEYKKGNALLNGRSVLEKYVISSNRGVSLSESGKWPVAI